MEGSGDLPFQSVFLMLSALPWCTVRLQIVKLNVHIFLVILLYTDSKYEFRLLCLVERSYINIGTKKEIAFDFRQKESLVPFTVPTMTKFQHNKKGSILVFSNTLLFDIPVYCKMKHYYY